MAHRIEAWEKDGQAAFVEVLNEQIWMHYTEFARLVTNDGWELKQTREVTEDETDNG